MKTKPGFYKIDKEGNWLYATIVWSADYTLVAELKDTYTYPVDGWVWYEDAPN